jgi:hypothetical protein
MELPMPPAALLEEWEVPLFERSVPMEEWIRAHWIDGGTFPAEPFAHLQHAHVGVLWSNVRAPVPGSGGERIVAGMAEIFEPRPAKRWIMERQVWAMHQLFGFELPDFVLTFDARCWAAETITVATKLALVTHELSHCGQDVDSYGQPKFVRQGARKGEPAYCIKPHDVEQFNLVVAWFGAEAAGVSEMVEAAAAAPLMRGEVQAFRCGTCGKAA